MFRPHSFKTVREQKDDREGEPCPKGERAPDSLYYLGQALMKLGQPGQACKAYAELEAVYGSKIRPDLKKLEMDAKAEAQC